MNLLDRYKGGQTKQVYDEIYALGVDAFLPENLPQVESVLNETFQRVSDNLVVIYYELKQTGYVFKENPEYNFELPLHKPLRDTDSLLKKLELAVAPFGFIPLSLKYFYRIVGGVNFAWDYNTDENIRWKMADPMQIASLDVVIETVTDEWWKEDIQEYIDDESFDTAFLELSADGLHKDNISGGPAYAIQITKEPSIDSSFLNEPNDTTFINYLRICFEYGGFPGITIAEEIKDNFQLFLEKVKPQLKII